MNLPMPEFRLQRINADGTSDKPEIHRLYEIPGTTQMRRRGFLGAGMTISSVLSLIGGFQGQTALGQATTTKTGTREIRGQRAGTPATAVYAHTGGVTALAISTNGKLLISGSDDRTVKLWSLPDGKLLRSLSGHEGAVNALGITADGRKLATGSSDPEHIVLKYWSLPEGKLLRSIDETEDQVYAITLTPGGLFLVGGTGNRRLKVWSLDDGKLLNTISDLRQRRVTVAAVSADGGLVAYGNEDLRVKLWSLVEGKFLRTLTSQRNGHKGRINSIAIAPDKGILASGSSDTTIKIWSLTDGQLQRTLNGHSGAVKALAVSPNNQFLISGSRDNQVSLWDLDRGKHLQNLYGHDNEITALAVSSDSTLLASGDMGGVILLWDLSTGEKLGYAFDASASKTDAFVYSQVDKATGQTITFTLPCGSPIPPGATCVCNCVPGTYRPAPIVSVPKPSVPSTSAPMTSPPRSGGYSGGGGGGGSICTCNKICVCIPVCQAHRLRHHDPVVRIMAEELLFVMGQREFGYMNWAASRAEKTLRTRIYEAMRAIRTGTKPNPARWPEFDDCVARLDDRDEIVAVMAAQMIQQKQLEHALRLDGHIQSRVNELLDETRQHPWFTRA